MTEKNPSKTGLSLLRTGFKSYRNLMLIIVLALVFRAALIPISLKIIYPGDHDDFVRWGIQSVDMGPLSLYQMPPDRHDIQLWDKSEKKWIITQRAYDRVCNYPPVSAYLLWLSGILHNQISEDRLINTVESHVLFSFWSILCDVLVAWGCAAIVSLFRPPVYSRWVFILTLFLPPLWYDSVIWAQMDSVVLAPAVWMLFFMLKNKWIVAGGLLGFALALKPQAILLIPLWGIVPFINGGSWRDFMSGVLSALVAIGILSLPFSVSGGWTSSGPDWFRLSYVENLFSTYSHLTTLKAFNIWYIDLLLTGSYDASEQMIGLTKDAWGKLFLLAGLAAGYIVCIKKFSKNNTVLILWAIFSLLCFLMLPTQVHERYLILVLPFLGVLVTVSKRFLPGFALLTIVMVGQLSWPQWLSTDSGSRGAWPEISKTIQQRYLNLADTLPEEELTDLAPLQSILLQSRTNHFGKLNQTFPYELAFTILALIGSGWVIIPFFRKTFHTSMSPTDASLSEQTNAPAGSATGRI